MKTKIKVIIIGLLLLLFFLAWSPWLDNQAIHDKVFQERAHKDGTMGWITYPNGTREYELICDYNVGWFPFGRYVGSCEGAYFVIFTGKIMW